MHNPIITIGFDKNAETDFEIADIGKLSLEDMKELRAMIVVAIGTAEDMFRRAKDLENPAGQKNTIALPSSLPDKNGKND